jgi:hypothetical protein
MAILRTRFPLIYFLEQNNLEYCISFLGEQNFYFDPNMTEITLCWID